MTISHKKSLSSAETSQRQKDELLRLGFPLADWPTQISDDEEETEDGNEEKLRRSTSFALRGGANCDMRNFQQRRQGAQIHPKPLKKHQTIPAAIERHGHVRHIAIKLEALVPDCSKCARIECVPLDAVSLRLELSGLGRPTQYVGRCIPSN